MPSTAESPLTSSTSPQNRIEPTAPGSPLITGLGYNSNNIEPTTALETPVPTRTGEISSSILFPGSPSIYSEEAIDLTESIQRQLRMSQQTEASQLLARHAVINDVTSEPEEFDTWALGVGPFVFGSAPRGTARHLDEQERTPGAVFESEIHERIHELKGDFWRQLASYGIARSSTTFQASVDLADMLMEGCRYPNMTVTEEPRLIQYIPSGSSYSHFVEDSSELNKQKRNFNWLFASIYNQMERVLGAHPLRNERDMIRTFQNHCQGIMNNFLRHVRLCVQSHCRCTNTTMFRDCYSHKEAKRHKQALLAEVYKAMIHYLLLLHQYKVYKLSLDIVRKQAPLVVFDELNRGYLVVHFFNGVESVDDEDIAAPTANDRQWSEHFRNIRDRERRRQARAQHRLELGLPEPEEDDIPWSIREH